jgi:hypothetical protein
VNESFRVKVSLRPLGERTLLSNKLSFVIARPAEQRITKTCLGCGDDFSAVSALEYLKGNPPNFRLGF